MKTESPLIIMSIKTEYADKILSGEKTMELRRVIPKGLKENDRIIIYSSGIDKAIVGEFTVSHIELYGRSDINYKYNYITKIACVSKEYLLFHIKDFIHGIHIKEFKHYSDKISLSFLRNEYDFKIPQNFLYNKNKKFENHLRKIECL